MVERRMIALEGLPFTGKSTAATALGGLMADIAIVPDYHDLLTPGDRLRMAALSESPDDQRRRVALYRELDDWRWKQSIDADARVVVFDRCFLSVAAYGAALHRTFGSTIWNGQPASGGDVTVCENMVPPVILFFDVDLDAAVDRHRRLCTTIDLRLRSPQFLSNLIDAYRCALADSGSEIVAIDSNRPLDAVVRDVCRYVHDAE